MKIFLFVLAATVFEASGDAVVRIALHHPSLLIRVGLFLLGAAHALRDVAQSDARRFCDCNGGVCGDAVRRLSNHQLYILPHDPHSRCAGGWSIDRDGWTGCFAMAVSQCQVGGCGEFLSAS